MARHYRPIAAAVVSALVLSIFPACDSLPKSGSTQPADSPLIQPAETPPAPVPPMPENKTALIAPYAGVAERNFGTHSAEFDAIIALIAKTAPDHYAPIEAQLLAILADPKSTTPAKMFACDELRVTASEKAIPYLAPLLADDLVAHNARRVLAALASPAADAALRTALAYTTGNLRIGLINTLGDRRDAKSIDPLKAIIQNAIFPKLSDTATVVASYNALGKIGTREAEQAFTSSSTPPAVKEAWAAAYLRCADTLAAEIGEGGWQSPGNLVPNMYGVLLAGDYSSAVKAGALTGSVNLLKEKSIPLILENLHSSDALLRKAAATAAISVPGNAATLALAAQLPKLKQDEKISLLATLTARGDSAGVTLAINQLAADESNQPLREAALASLATLGDASSVPILAAALKSSGNLSKIAWQSLADLDTPNVTAALLKQTHTADPAVRAAVINSLAEKHIASLLPDARLATKDADPAVRSSAFKAVGILGDATDYTALLARLATEKDSTDQTAILDALSSLSRHNEKDKNPLIDATIDALPKSPPEPRARLLTVLSVLGGDKALHAITAELASTDDPVRKSAVRVLSNWQTNAPINDLLKVAKSDPDESMKILALQGYIRMTEKLGGNDRKISALKTALSLATRTEEKRRALSALANISSPASLGIVEPLLAEKDLTNESYNAYEKIAESLAKSNPTAAKPALEKISKDSPNAAQRDKATKLLETIK